MTTKEILEVVESKMSVDSFAHFRFNVEELGLGEIEEVYQHGGEGEGDHWESVKHFKDHGIYIQTVGRYSSYYGTDFDDGYGEEVKPKEKTITIYE